MYFGRHEWVKRLRYVYIRNINTLETNEYVRKPVKGLTVRSDRDMIPELRGFDRLLSKNEYKVLNPIIAIDNMLILACDESTSDRL